LALTQYLLRLRNSVNKMRKKIAIRFQHICFKNFKELWLDSKIGKSIRMSRLKPLVNDPVIGIHLGNLYSEVAFSKNGSVESYK
jgi:hypothetical protein